MHNHRVVWASPWLCNIQHAMGETWSTQVWNMHGMITLVNQVCIATCRLDMQVQLTCHLEDAVVFSNIMQKVLGMRVVSIIQLLEIFRGRRKLLQSNLSFRTADRWRFTRKPYCAGSANVSHLTQARFCLKWLRVILLCRIRTCSHLFFSVQ